MKRTGILLALAGAGWASYQVHHAYHNLHNLLPTNGVKLEQKVPEYIYYTPKVNDSDYCQLAQACDPRTAVGLARTKGVDLRLFLKPPNYPPPTKKEDLIDSCHEILGCLNNKEAHECIQYFVSEVLPEIQENHAQYSSRINQEYLLTLCLKSLLHHSNLPNHSSEIVRHGGLKLLMDIYYHYPDSKSIESLLGKIISNIAEPKHSKQMLSSGWVGVLANWLSSPNILINSPAGKALANLDEDDRNLFSYRGGIYLLHPLHRNMNSRPSKDIKLDVVFVHGLLGGIFWTWRNRDRVRIDFSKATNEDIPQLFSSSSIGVGKDASRGLYEDFLTPKPTKRTSQTNLCDCPVRSKRESGENFLDMSSCYRGSELSCPMKDVTECWPVDWLTKDLPSLRVIGLNYDTYISMWMPVCPEETLHTSLEQRSEEFIKKLLPAGIGKRPIIWVAHSMGGLIVKSILVKAFESEDKELKALCEKTKGTIFYSVPHFGSHLADLKQATKMLLLPSKEVNELGYNSPALLSLHKRFMKFIEKFPVDILSFVETETTTVTSLKLQLRFVTAESADLGVGEFYEVPSNHLDICKPTNRRSFLYQKVLVFIEKFLKDS